MYNTYVHDCYTYVHNCLWPLDPNHYNFIDCLSVLIYFYLSYLIETVSASYTEVQTCSLFLSNVLFQPFGNCEEEACVLWACSPSFTWSEAFKLCHQWAACFWGTLCFKKCIPHLFKVHACGCCTGTFHTSLNLLIIFFSLWLVTSLIRNCPHLPILYRQSLDLV